MTFFLGIDLGASSLKATIVDEAGHFIGQARASIATTHPQTGYAEQDPEAWVAALLSACADLRHQNASVYANITTIAMSGGAHIAVLCDADDTPLRPAILWSDQRAAPQAQQLQEDGQAEAISGNRPNATWTLAQLMWLRQHQPEIISQCQRLYFAKDWLRAHLTNIWQSDSGEATGSMLADYRTGLWSPPLIEMAGLRPDVLPPLVTPMAEAGTLTPQAAQETGLTAGIQILQGTIDTTMEWLCCAPLSPHTASLKLASAGVLAISTPHQWAKKQVQKQAQPLPPLSLYPHILPEAVYYAAGMNQCVPALTWVREVLLGDIAQDDMRRLAETAPLGAGGVLFHPYLSGERAPLWQADATASLHGLHRGSTNADIARAAYEGIGFAFCDIWHDMSEQLPQMPDALFVLGGGAQCDFWCQILTDMLGVPLTRGAQSTQGDASFAGALLAGVGAGAFTLSDIKQTDFTIFTPDKDCHSRYCQVYDDYKLWRKK